MGWFEPQCPVDVESKNWIEGQMAWLVERFGWDRLIEAPAVLPTEEFFPDAYDGSEADVRRLFDRVAGYMHADPTALDLEVSSRGDPITGRTHLTESAEDHHEHERKTRISLEIPQLGDAVSAVATLAYELGHALLIGKQEASPEEDDCEPLIDLLTVFLGLGVFAANTILGSQRGYLTAPMFGYALALFAWLREESDPTWSSALRPDVRTPFRDGLQYLLKTGDSTIIRPGDLVAGKSCGCTTGCSASPHSQTAETGSDELPEAAELKPETADDYFTRGTIHANGGEWEHALADFSEAVRLAPDDPECYQQRAMVYIHMNRPDEALADAEEALRLDPDDADFYHARGMAYVGTQQYEAAIEDLDLFISEEQGARGVETHLIEAFFFRGLAQAGLGQWRQAIADYTRAIGRTPGFADAHAARGMAYEKLGKTAKADADRNEALRLSQPPADT